jgi:endonuclease III
MEESIVAVLKEHRRLHRKSDSDLLPKDVADLIDNNWFAFLVGSVFQRGISWEKAWEIPYRIDQRCMLEPSKLASATDSELKDLIDNLPVRPRYPNQAIRTLRESAELVKEFGGKADAIWTGATPHVVRERLQRIYGVGQGLAAMVVLLLRDQYDFFIGDEQEIDVKPDIHVMRVLKRSGLIQAEREDLAIQGARRLSPQYPAALDWPTWDIGQRWCHSTNPDCVNCPLTGVCPKLI